MGRLYKILHYKQRAKIFYLYEYKIFAISNIFNIYIRTYCCGLQWAQRFVKRPKSRSYPSIYKCLLECEICLSISKTVFFFLSVSRYIHLIQSSDHFSPLPQNQESLFRNDLQRKKSLAFKVDLLDPNMKKLKESLLINTFWSVD